MISYGETLREVGRRARELRLFRELRQDEVAERAGLAPITVARFERTGQASLENALRIAMVLGAEEPFQKLFEAPRYRTLDEALARPPMRQRIRKRRQP